MSGSSILLTGAHVGPTKRRADERRWRKAVISQANRKQMRWSVYSDLNRLPTTSVYGVLMLRLVFLLIAIVLSILPAVASAAPAHNRPAPRWHGYGFLPGYHQPPNNSLPAYAQRDSVS